MSLSAGSLYDYITPADSCRRGRRRSTEWAGEQPAVVVVDGVSPVKKKRARWATTGRRRRATASGSSSGSRWTFSGRPIIWEGLQPRAVTILPLVLMEVSGVRNSDAVHPASPQIRMFVDIQYVWYTYIPLLSSVRGRIVFFFLLC